MWAFKFGRVGGFSREPATYQNDKSPKNKGRTRLINICAKLLRDSQIYAWKSNY